MSYFDQISIDDVSRGTQTNDIKITLDGEVIAASQSGTWSFTDGGGSITVDGTITANAGSGTFNVQEPLSIDDNGGSLTVDGSVSIASSLPSGTNNIGDVDILTQPARDRLIDNQGVALQTDVLMNDTTTLTPKYAVIDVDVSGDNTIVSAVTGKKIRVIAYTIVASAAVTVRFESGASGTALTGQMQLAANGGVAANFNPVGWFETASGALLNLELSAATSVDGHITYIEV